MFLEDYAGKGGKSFMKLPVMILMSLAMTATLACRSTSPRGGGVSRDETFRISVPGTRTKVTQGELETVTVSLRRGKYFKQDVELEITAPEGIRVEPSDVLVRAGDSSEVQVRIEAAPDAPIGEYLVHVRGTPETGESTLIHFRVRVDAR